MITKWKVFNFKSIRKQTELEIAPLTVFAGVNSSGKSTFLQSILLVAQTLAHKVASRSVVLNGAFARLGQFDDLRTVDSDADQIVIGWESQPVHRFRGRHKQSFRIGDGFSHYQVMGSLASVSCDIAFDTEADGSQREITQIQPRLFSTQLSVLTRDPDGADRRFFVTIRRTKAHTDVSKQKWLDVSDNDDPLARTSLQYDVELDNESLADIREELSSAQPVGCLLRHFLPSRVSVGVNVVTEDVRAILSVLAGEGTRAVARGLHVDREIAVPYSVVRFILNSTDDYLHTLPFLQVKLAEERTMLGPSGISLETLQGALKRIPVRERAEMRRKMFGSGEVEELVDKSVRAERGEESAVILSRLPGVIAEASGYLEHFFSTCVKYLGPLRDEPKSLYPLSPTADPSMWA